MGYSEFIEKKGTMTSLLNNFLININHFRKIKKEIVQIVLKLLRAKLHRKIIRNSFILFRDNRVSL